MSEIPYRIITGHRSDSRLLFTEEEQHLYVQKRRRKTKNGYKIEYICYQTILCKQSTSDNPIPKCTAGIEVENGICRRKKKPHSNHCHHKAIYDDLQSRHKINNDCMALKNLLEGLTESIPAQKIFTRELSK